MFNFDFAVFLANLVILEYVILRLYVDDYLKWAIEKDKMDRWLND